MKMTTMNETTLGGFSQYLVTAGYANETDVTHATKESITQGISLISYLGHTQKMDYTTLAQAIADYFCLPFVDLNDYDLASLPLTLLPFDLILKNSILPLFVREKELALAVADPTILHLIEINFITGFASTLFIVEGDKLSKAITRLQTNDLALCLDIESDKVVTPTHHDDITSGEAFQPDMKPLVKFLNEILLDAIHKNASDIHFEPYEENYRIRFRLDGILHEIYKPPLKLAKFVITRLKVIANLDISEHRLPQDGRFKLHNSSFRSTEFRLSTCPTLYGEKAVLRILKTANDLLELDHLGMNQLQKLHFENALKQTEGMILVTGPTGSGKTNTLYTALHRLNTSTVNITSAEDPIEVYLNGVNQVSINLKAGLTFANILRAFLRQDPDIIMIGEIRDLETAEIAMSASQTGHLVLSTLHTNSAIETLNRFNSIGIDTYNVANSIKLIVAQRLVRQLCSYCKLEVNLSKDLLLKEGFSAQEIPLLKIYNPSHCKHCNQGYRGRVGVFEVLPVSKEMSALIMRNANTLELARQAKAENLQTIRSSALDKVRQGITSLSEASRVIQHV